jgi:hypothetical protein
LTLNRIKTEAITLMEAEERDHRDHDLAKDD